MVFGAGCYTPGNDPYAASFFGAENAPLLPPPGTTDASSLAKGVGKHAGREIKEWQAIMDHMRRLPVKKKGDLPVIPVDERVRGAGDQESRPRKSEHGLKWNGCSDGRG